MRMAAGTKMDTHGLNPQRETGLVVASGWGFEERRVKPSNLYGFLLGVMVAQLCGYAENHYLPTSREQYST